MSDSSNRNLIKIFNPILAAVKTYRTSAQVVKIGSGDSADLQIFLPSLQTEHIIVDLDEQKVMAVGNDVHCDAVPLPPGSSQHFNNDSVIRIHSIFMGFYKPGGAFNSSAYDKNLISAASRYREFSPIFKIVHCNCQDNDDLDVEGSMAIGDSERQLQVSETITSFYEREIGHISSVPPIESPMGEFLDQSSLSPASKAIEATRKEFEEIYRTKPSDKILEAAIERKLEDVNEQAIEALDGTVDIPLVRHPPSDLGTIAIENSILQEAKAEVQSAGSGKERDRILEAQINSVDLLKNSITDNIKEEMRESISKIVQEEVQDKIGTAVEECIQSSKIKDAIAEQVAGKVFENESLDEKTKKARSYPIEAKDVDENNSGRNSAQDSVSAEKPASRITAVDGKATASKKKEKLAAKAVTKREASGSPEDSTKAEDKSAGRKKRKAAVSNPSPRLEETRDKTSERLKKDARDRESASKKKKESTGSRE